MSGYIPAFKTFLYCKSAYAINLNKVHKFLCKAFGLELMAEQIYMALLFFEYISKTLEN